jgi:hypothetical protein
MGAIHQFLCSDSFNAWWMNVIATATPNPSIAFAQAVQIAFSIAIVKFPRFGARLQSTA